MSIEKIEIKQDIWERSQDEKGNWHSKLTGSKTFTHTRKGYKGDFERMILWEIPDYDIKSYAEDLLDMTNKDDCECDSIGDAYTGDLIYELKQRGYEVIKCETIADSLKMQKVKEIMDL